MSYAAGVDIGTGSTVVVLYGKGEFETVHLGVPGPDVPTMVGFDESDEIVFGERAVDLRIRNPSAASFSFKRRVPETTPLVVGGRAVAALDLYVGFLVWVVNRLTTHEGRAPAAIAVTHPAGWRPQMLARIAAGISSAGVDQPVTFVAEPIAAWLAYTAQRGRADGAFAVLDIGECSVVVSIVRDGQVVGIPVSSPRVGGVDFDEAILDHVLRNVGDDLAPPDIDDPQVITTLHALRAECARAKIVLSTNTYTEVRVRLHGHPDRLIRLTRIEFEEMIRVHVTAVATTVMRCLETNDVAPADLDGVLLAGGSARIPLVSQIVASEIRRPILNTAVPELLVATGAALHAATPVPDPSEGPSAVGAQAGMPRDLVAEGDALRMAAKFVDAELVLTQAIDGQPDSPAAWALRGDVRRLQGEHVRALADLDRALSLDPQFAPALAWRAATLRWLRRHDDALRDLDELVRIRPRCAWGRALRGSVHLLSNRHQPARRDLDVALTLDPRHAFALGQRGHLSQREGRLRDALQDLDRSVELDPSSGWVRQRRAEVADAYR